MASTAEQVRRCIDEDVFLQELLARGIVNYSKLARWLQENRGLEADETNIAQAVPRNAPASGSQAMARAWASLQGSRIDHHGGLASLELDLTQSTLEALPSLMEAAEPARGGSFRILHDGRSMTLILGEDTLAQATENLLGEEAPGETVEDLAEVKIVPEDGEDLHPAVVSLTVAYLATKGIEVCYTTGEGRWLSIFVHGTDSRATFDTLEALTK